MGNGVHTYAPRATSSDAIVMNKLCTAIQLIGGHSFKNPPRRQDLQSPKLWHRDRTLIPTRPPKVLS